MTYRKIAQLAGVSLSTVSKALSGSTEISRETAERVRSIAEEYGVLRPRYRHSSPPLRVAVFVPEIISIHYSQKVTDIIAELERSDVEPCIYVLGFGRERFCRQLDRLLDDGQVDGIISLVEHEYPKPTELPLLYMCHTGGFSSHDTVWFDLEGGIFEAVEYMLLLGHRRCGFIGEKNTGCKLDYFKSAAARLGLELDPRFLFISDKRFEEIGYEGAEYFSRLNERPTAVLAAYDEVALGAVHALKSRGIAVPDDISVIGINDIPFSSYADTPLTTVRTYGEELAHTAVKLLLDKLREPGKHPVQHISLQCRLIVRETTSRAK